MTPNENKSQLEFGMFDKAMQVGKTTYINDHNFGFYLLHSI